MLPLLPLLASLSLATATPSHYSPFHQTTTTTLTSCPLIFDGRVPPNASLADFNTALGGGWNPFNPGYVKGNNLSWSDILLLPRYVPRSRFDAAESSLPLEVTISDASVFMQQHGFRRAGLQFADDANEGSPAAEGVVTLHFSLLRDDARPLNLSHEYLVCCLDPAERKSLVANTPRTSGTRPQTTQPTNSTSKPAPSSTRAPSPPTRGSSSTETTSSSGPRPCSRTPGKTLALP